MCVRSVGPVRRAATHTGKLETRASFRARALRPVVVVVAVAVVIVFNGHR